MGIEEAGPAAAFGETPVAGIGEGAVCFPAVDNDLSGKTAVDQEAAVRTEIQTPGPGAVDGKGLDLTEEASLLVCSKGQQEIIAVSLGVHEAAIWGDGHTLLLPGSFFGLKTGKVGIKGLNLFYMALFVIAEGGHGDLVFRSVLMVDVEIWERRMEGAVTGLAEFRVREGAAQQLQLSVFNGIQIQVAVALVAAGIEVAGRGAHDAVGWGTVGLPSRE